MKKTHAMTSSQARSKKLLGHKREIIFNKLFGNPRSNINFSGSSADCTITMKGLQEAMKSLFNLNQYSVSLKGGSTTQIHLGWIDELTDRDVWFSTLTRKLISGKLATCGDHGIAFTSQEKTLKQPCFWNKYLGKGDLLVYTDDKGIWWFFKMQDVINLICNNFTWRLLETGRIKGDYTDGINTKQIFTYEFRDESHKKTFVLGAHGGRKGLDFRNIICARLDHVLVQSSSKLKMSVKEVKWGN
jgi:hypothetical protein